MRIPKLLFLLPMLLVLLAAADAPAQKIRLKDLVQLDNEVPVRLVGYGLVTGLDGTGDRALGGTAGSVQTVRSVANLLRRFDVVVPEEMLRVRNVAVVLVTAEVSPFARAGSRFDVQVSSVGDALSISGGVLWMTPLLTDAGTDALATAQGPLLSLAPERAMRSRRIGSARIAQGGVLERPLGETLAVTDTVTLVLKEPDATMAGRIADAANKVLGDSSATALDPGAVRVTLAKQGRSAMQGYALLQSATVDNDAAARLIYDTRTGSVIMGGDIPVGAATVSAASVSLSVDSLEDASVSETVPAPATTTAVAPAQGAPVDSMVPPPVDRKALDNPARLAGAVPQQPVGYAAPEPVRPAPSPRKRDGVALHSRTPVTVQQVVASLRTAQTSTAAIGEILLLLQAAGAIRAEVIVR